MYTNLFQSIGVCSSLGIKKSKPSSSMIYTHVSQNLSWLRIRSNKNFDMLCFLRNTLRWPTKSVTNLSIFISYSILQICLYLFFFCLNLRLTQITLTSFSTFFIDNSWNRLLFQCPFKNMFVSSITSKYILCNRIFYCLIIV